MSDIHAPANPPGGATPGKSYRELAIWSLLCAMLVLPPAGAIMGVVAQKNMRASHNYDGRYFALASIVIGVIFTAIYAVLYALGKYEPLGLGIGPIVITSSTPLYLALQVWFGYAWSGRWRIAALVPLIVMGPVLIITVMGAVGGSNLWPLPLILLSPIGLAYLLITRAARAMVDRRSPSSR
jgi:hypothetical protein